MGTLMAISVVEKKGRKGVSAYPRLDCHSVETYSFKPDEYGKG